MTEQEQKAFDQMLQALKDIAEESFDKGAVECANHALTAANAVSHPKPETTPSPEGGAITSESAANAVSHPQATAPAGWKLVPVEPTQEMLDAVVTTVDDHLLGPDAEKQYREDWAAMLAAAPEAHHE